MPDAATPRETHAFQAEVGRVLQIVAHSLYSDREVFLRELVANAADSCDRLRFAALSQPGLLAEGTEFAVTVEADEDTGVLRIADNGFGMNRDELVENLGSIARSGAAAFIEAAQAGGDSAALRQIGQFGVGFYSVFMVADRVRVTTRKAGESDAFVWESDGAGAFTVGPAGADDPVIEGHGALIDLVLKEDAQDYLKEAVVAEAVRKRADHIGLPVRWGAGEGARQLNAGRALWTRSKSDVTDEQYTEAFRQFGGFGDPWATLHFQAEGVVSYSALLFAPKLAGFDIFDPDRRNHLRLHVKQVFITDDRQDLVPAWLRFLVGVVDSEDLPLNVSRETPQSTPIVARMRKTLTRKILDLLKARAQEDPEGYADFWAAFGAVLKEGLYEDGEWREGLSALIRFRSTTQDGLTGFEDYVSRMKEGQEAIYFMVGEGGADALAHAPQVEGFRKAGIEVALFADPVDAFWTSVVAEAAGKPLRSVTRGADDLDRFQSDEDADSADETEKPETGAVDALVTALRLALGEEVADIRASRRLTDSPVCLVAPDGGVDLAAERILRRGRGMEEGGPRVLEVNPGHPMILALADALKTRGDGVDLGEAGRLLMDQARILDGEPPADARAFSRRLAALSALAWGR